MDGAVECVVIDRPTWRAIRKLHVKLPVQFGVAFLREWRLLATYTLETIHPFLEVETARLGFAAELYQAPFNSVRQELLDPRSGANNNEPKYVYVAQLLEDVCPALLEDFLDLSPADVDH